MNSYTINLLCKQFRLDEKIIDYVNKREKSIIDKFDLIDEISEFGQLGMAMVILAEIK